MDNKDYTTILNEVVKELNENSFTKDDFETKEHDNETVNEIITEVVDEYISKFDGFNYVERDLGQYQRKELIHKIYDSVIEFYN